MTIWICRPDFSRKHFTINCIDNRWLFDLKTLIHATSFGILFFPRAGERRKKANDIHRKLRIRKEQVKQLGLRILAAMNWAEGIIHLAIATIGFWGCVALSQYDVRLLAPNVENAIFGVFSILTGYFLGKR